MTQKCGECGNHWNPIIMNVLGLIQTQHFYKQYCNIGIKRYFDKKDSFQHIFFSLCELKIVIFANVLVYLENHIILKCHYNTLKKKLYFDRNIFNIFLLQYCVQKYCV